MTTDKEVKSILAVNFQSNRLEETRYLWSLAFIQSSEEIDVDVSRESGQAGYNKVRPMVNLWVRLRVLNSQEETRIEECGERKWDCTPVCGGKTRLLREQATV